MNVKTEARSILNNEHVLRVSCPECGQELTVKQRGERGNFACSMCGKVSRAYVAVKGDKSAELYQHQHGYWGEHPDHPVWEWKAEVSGGETRKGYWEWVEAREDDGND